MRSFSILIGSFSPSSFVATRGTGYGSDRANGHAGGGHVGLGLGDRVLPEVEDRRGQHGVGVALRRPPRRGGRACPPRRRRSPGSPTASVIAAVSSRSNPAFVPSRSIDVRRISPAPSASARWAHSTASMPGRRAPAVGERPRGGRRRPSGRRWRPRALRAELRRRSRVMSSGRSTAAVFTDTLSAPTRSRRRASSTERMPPPIVNGMKTCSATRLAISTIVSRALGRGGDVEEHELVGALGVVAGGQLHGVAGIDEVDEVHALHDAARVDVEARDDPGGPHRRASAARRRPRPRRRGPRRSRCRRWRRPGAARPPPPRRAPAGRPACRRRRRRSTSSAVAASTSARPARSAPPMSPSTSTWVTTTASAPASSSVTSASAQSTPEPSAQPRTTTSRPFTSRPMATRCPAATVGHQVGAVGLQRGGAHHDAGHADVGQRARPPRALRTPPPACTGHVDRRGDGGDEVAVDRLARCGRRRGRPCGSTARRRRRRPWPPRPGRRRGRARGRSRPARAAPPARRGGRWPGRGPSGGDAAASAACTNAAQRGQAGAARLLGVELRGPHGAPLDGGHDRAAVVAGGADDGVVGVGRVGVHEVGPRRIGRVGAAAGSRPGARAGSTASAGASRRRGAGAPCRAGRRGPSTPGRLLGPLEEQLHADADPEERHARAPRPRGRRRRGPCAAQRAPCSAPKAPTPGSTTPAASRTSPGSAVRRASAPTCWSAFWAERRFPIS